MAVFGYWWLKKIITGAVNKGERFEDRETDPNFDVTRPLPNPFLAMIPLLVVPGISFIFHDSLK
jgi:hypothetical protein